MGENIQYYSLVSLVRSLQVATTARPSHDRAVQEPSFSMSVNNPSNFSRLSRSSQRLTRHPYRNPQSSQMCLRRKKVWRRKSVMARDGDGPCYACGHGRQRILRHLRKFTVELAAGGCVHHHVPRLEHANFQRSNIDDDCVIFSSTIHEIILKRKHRTTGKRNNACSVTRNICS